MNDTADRIVDLYRRHAQTWTSMRGRELVERAWIERFSAALAFRSTVLDIGCGSGEPIARALSDRGFVVTGVDASPEMIALFRANIPAATALTCDMRSLSLPQKFGGLIAWDSFFHLCPDHQRLMFPVFRDHCRPGAPLLFTSGPKFGEAIGMLQGEPLYHASLDPEEYHSMLDRNGFDVLDHVSEDPDCGHHTIWLARLR